MLTSPNINENNLLRFKSTTAPTVATSTYATRLNSGNRLWRRTVNSPLPALKGETYTFYTNFDQPTFDAANIVLVKDENCSYTEITDVNEPSVTATTWGTNNLKIVITIPSTATENQFIRVGVLSDGPSPTITHVTNSFLVQSLTEQTINNTHLFKFYHNTDIYNYEWANYDPLLDTPYTLRLPSTVKTVEYPREVATYESATTGRPRNTRVINRKDYGLQIYFREDDDHDGVAVMVNFKYLEINGKQFLPIDSYEIEYNDSFNIYVGTIKLRDVDFSVRITRCV